MLEIIRSERGFALPSILLLVTILSLIAASIIGLQYFMKQIVLTDIGKIKAAYAAESGIARALNSYRSPQSPLSPTPFNHFKFEDGSEAQTQLQPWGMFLRIS